MIDESDLKALNKLLAQTEPSSNIFNYLLFRRTNQFKPIAKLLHEASLWFVLFLLSTTASTILAIMASLYELSSMRSTIFVLLLVLDCVIFLISILIGKSISIERETSTYKDFETNRWNDDFETIKGFIKSHHMNSRQVDALISICIDANSSFLNQANNSIAYNLTITGGVIITLGFSVATIAADGSPPTLQIFSTLIVALAIAGTLKLYHTILEFMRIRKRKNPVGRLVEVLEIAKLNGAI